MRREFAACLWLALASILPAAGLAQTQTPPQARPHACTPSDFTGRVQLLHAASGQQLSDFRLIVEDLREAYCNASDLFRYQLDSVDFVFVDATGCPDGAQGHGDMTRCNAVSGDQSQNASWGMRGERGYTQIGIPAGLWPQNKHAINYTDYEAAVVNRLVGPWTNANNKVSFSVSGGNPAGTPWMTVLAVLAHELGHIRWAEVNIRGGFGQPYDFSRLNACSFFASWQFHEDLKLQPKNRWRRFGERTNELDNEHLNPPKFNFDYQDATTDQLRGKLLLDLYATGQPWASYLGANAPDEDYVETYKMDVLAGAGLTTMPMTIPTAPGTTPDIPGDLASGSKTALPDKMSCLRKVH